jgi:hypothetical protein
MKIGDLVRVIGIPDNLSDDADPGKFSTKAVFERSVGSVYPIIDITTEGLVELQVGEAVGVEPYLHSIWLEPEFLVFAEISN